jgi:hypothetical protein
LNNTYDEICLTADKPEDMVFVIISLRKSPYKTLASTQTIKQYQEKSRKVAQEILASPDLRKKFKVLFMKGNSWIDELARIYGPFTGYELNEFISWFRAGEKQAPKLKALPKAFEPKKPVLVSKISKNEAGIEPEGNVMIKKEESLKRQNPVEQGTNIFNPKSEESVKFTFKAKQRFNDLKEVLKTNKGFIDEGIVKSLPERECLEIIKDPPMSVPEKYEAFLIEEVLIPPPAVKTAPPSKPLFSTNFRLPDNLKIKTETAKQLLSNKPDLLSEPYVHKFRDDFDAKAVGKPEFVLRLPKPREEPLVRIAEPLEKLKKQQKEEKKRMEDEEKLRRTQLYGKIRGEWVFGFKPVSSFYELGTGEPHKLLPKDEYLETFKLSSRAS